LLAFAMAGGAWAQSVPDNEPPQPVPGQVLSDIQPLPAEDRESMGAVVLDDSRVRAQQTNAFNAAGERTGIPSAIGRNVSRLLERARSWNEIREADATPIPTR
jgi:hypothetical protein